MNLTINTYQNNYTSPSIPVPLSIVSSTGQIKIGASSMVGTASGFTTAVTNNTSVDIVVEMVGFHPYSMTIDNVYQDDHTIDITLAQILPIVAAPYDVRFARSFAFVDSCSFKADYYSASSLPGNISWYVKNVLYGTGLKAKFDFIAPGSYQVKNVSEYTSGGVTYFEVFTTNTSIANGSVLGNLLASNTTSNLIISEYRPDLSLGFTTPNKPLASTVISCYATGEIITVTPTWTLNRPGAVASNHNIIYTITDPDGTVVVPDNISGLPQSTFPLNTTFANASVTFTLSKLGTYKVEAKIKDFHCNTEFPIEYCLETCKFINIKYKSCNVYTIENKSSTETFNFSIAQHGVVNTSNVATGTLLPGTSADVTFANPGLFIMTATYGAGITEKYIISNHCEIEKCISSYITDLLCGGDNECSPCPEDNELNQILLMSYAYFMKLNKQYSLNNFYTGLSQSKLDELTSISQVLNKLALFCTRRGCNGSTTTSFASGTNAGQSVYTWTGTNQSCNCNNKANGSVSTSSGCGCSSCS